MVFNQDLVKIQKYKYKQSLCMVFNFDLSKLQKYKYKESLCIWYPFQTWSKYRNTNTKISLDMVSNLDLSKIQKHKYKESLCMWYRVVQPLGTRVNPVCLQRRARRALPPFQVIHQRVYFQHCSGRKIFGSFIKIATK